MHLLSETEKDTTTTTSSSSDQIKLLPWLGFASIAAFLCSSLEISLLECVDSLSMQMTPWEIALEAGVALIVLLGLSIAWWLGTLVVAKTLRMIPGTRRYSTWVCWCLWLAFPFSYFGLELLAAIRLQMFPNWQPGALSSLMSGLSLIVICAAGFFRFGLSGVQKFCRIRLAPIGWIHVVLGFAITLILLVHGVHPFHDFAGPARPFAGSRPPDIYVITIDALRAQDMSVYGYDRPTTPNLQRFAQHSFTFENFIANSNLTAPTTTSIETGKLPWSHRVFELGSFLRNSAQQETLPALLRQRGYYTAMISSNVFASPFSRSTLASYDAAEYAAPLGLAGVWMSNPAGINGQFTLFFSLLRRLGSLASFLDRVIWRRYPYPAETVFGQARDLIESRDDAQPMFVWTHIFPPHDPYWPPAPYRMRFAPRERLVQVHGHRLAPDLTASELRAQYDEMILYADHAVGDYLDWLEQTGRLDRAIVIVTSDHGESFEHGFLLHGGPHLYSGLIHIPLMIHLPGQQQREIIAQPAEQVDLLPTLLDLVGAPVPGWTDGGSLRPALEGKSLPQRQVFSMALETDSTFRPISKGTLAIMDDDFKYVIHLDTQEQELYRYKTDPSEEINLTKSDPDVAQRMHDLLISDLRKANEPLVTR
jgi:arylsulfatase A-like enzyme